MASAYTFRSNSHIVRRCAAAHKHVGNADIMCTFCTYLNIVQNIYAESEVFHDAAKCGKRKNK